MPLAVASNKSYSILYCSSIIDAYVAIRPLLIIKCRSLATKYNNYYLLLELKFKHSCKLKLRISTFSTHVKYLNAVAKPRDEMRACANNLAQVD